jgi:hypothetical protein
MACCDQVTAQQERDKRIRCLPELQQPRCHALERDCSALHVPAQVYGCVTTISPVVYSLLSPDGFAHCMPHLCRLSLCCCAV